MSHLFALCHTQLSSTLCVIIIIIIIIDIIIIVVINEICRAPILTVLDAILIDTCILLYIPLIAAIYVQESCAIAKMTAQCAL